MEKTSRFLQSLLKLAAALALLFLFPLGCLISGSIYMEYFGKEQRKTVGDTVPDLFPVLVVIPDATGEGYAAEIVYNRNLPEYKEKNPGYGFLIPEGLEARFREVLSKQTQSHTGDFDDRTLPFSVDFTVIRRQGGSHSIEVRYRENDDWKRLPSTEQDSLSKFYRPLPWPRVLDVLNWTCLLAQASWIGIAAGKWIELKAIS